MIRSKPSTPEYRDAWDRVFVDAEAERKPYAPMTIEQLAAMAQANGFQPDAVCTACRRLVVAEGHVCGQDGAWKPEPMDKRRTGHCAGCAMFSTVLGGPCDCPPEGEG